MIWKDRRQSRTTNDLDRLVRPVVTEPGQRPGGATGRSRDLRGGVAAFVIVLAVLVGAAPVGAEQSDRIASQQARAKVVICKVFGPHCGEALNVSWCESKWYVWAVNGQYRGLFQMGSWERSKYGHGSGAWAQARAAYRYFAASGKDWSPWACKP